MTGSSLESGSVAVVVVLLTLHHCTTLLADVCDALLGVVRSVNRLRSELRVGSGSKRAELFQLPSVDASGASREDAVSLPAAPAAKAPTAALAAAPPSQD